MQRRGRDKEHQNAGAQHDTAPPTGLGLFCLKRGRGIQKLVDSVTSRSYS